MFKNSKDNQRGLTLLETVVAIYILTMGVTSVVGTAIYSFSTQGKLLDKFIAMQLSREGVEIVREIRDTNWLPPNELSLCSDLGSGQYCYPAWQDDLSTNCAVGCQAVFNSSNGTWQLTKFSSLDSYALYKQENSTYTPTSNGESAKYYRKIRVVRNTNIPYTAENPELIVTSTVAWVGSGCPNNLNNKPDDAKDQCKVRVEDRLTNWKNY